jgi:hypothetical protein
MEPLSALSIATAIAQFIEFVTKLGLNAHEIFHAALGQSAKDEKLEDVYQILADLSRRLAQGCNSAPMTAENGPADAFDARTRGLRELSLKCKQDCDAILCVVGGATAADGKGKLWRSVKAAVRSSIGKRRIAELETSLGRTQAIMSLHIQSILV